MADITSLPIEIIIQIFKNINIDDIINFTFINESIRQKLENNNKFWEKKYYKRCLSAKKRYNTEKQEQKFQQINFEEKIRISMKCIKKLKDYVTLMSKDEVTSKKKIKLEGLLRFTAKDSMVYYFVLDELNSPAQLQWQLDSNLTQRYNFDLISYYLKQYRLLYKLFKFFKLPKDNKQLLEKMITIVAQYIYPHISYSVIRTWLNNIAETIRQRIKNEYPTHSIASTCNETFSYFEKNKTYNNHWNPTETTQIMDILIEFIFSNLDVNELLVTLHLKDEHIINCIYEFFRRCFLIVTFHSVARRLGIHCAVSVTTDYEPSIEILWNPNYNAEDFKYTQYLEFNRSYPFNIVKKPIQNTLYNEECTLTDTLALKRITTGFLHKLRDNNIHCWWKFNLLFSLIDRSAEYENIKERYKDITHPIQEIHCIDCLLKYNETIRPKKRRERIMFAVGMIVTHSWQHYNPHDQAERDHDGVIVGWHRNCDTNFESKLGGICMFPYLRKCYKYYHICQCETKSEVSDLPHYIILTENNKLCYVRENHIVPCAAKEIDNVEIGRFFSTFAGTHYVPNGRLAKQYPTDTARLIKQFRNQ